jgi:hypothetical protein
VVARALCWTLPEPGFPAQACLSLSSSTEQFGYSSVARVAKHFHDRRRGRGSQSCRPDMGGPLGNLVCTVLTTVNNVVGLVQMPPTAAMARPECLTALNAR